MPIWPPCLIILTTPATGCLLSTCKASGMRSARPCKLCSGGWWLRFQRSMNVAAGVVRMPYGIVMSTMRTLSGSPCQELVVLCLPLMHQILESEDDLAPASANTIRSRQPRLGLYLSVCIRCTFQLGKACCQGIGKQLKGTEVAAASYLLQATLIVDRASCREG